MTLFVVLAWTTLDEARAVVAEQAQQADEDQVQGHDVVEQPGHHQNENSGDQGDERPDGQGEGHKSSSCASAVANLRSRARFVPWLRVLGQKFSQKRRIRSQPVAMDGSSVAKHTRT